MSDQERDGRSSRWWHSVRWNIFGLKVAPDWIAIVGLLIMLWVVIVQPLIQELREPRIDIVTPDALNIICDDYAEEQRESKSVWICDDHSVLKLVVTQFSISNSSRPGTKDEVVQKITGSIALENEQRVPLEWQFFSDLTGDARDPRSNAGRFVLKAGEIRNQEVEFSVSDTLNWSSIEKGISADDKAYIAFVIDFLHTVDRDVECELALGSLKTQLPHFYVTARNVKCELVALADRG